MLYRPLTSSSTESNSKHAKRGHAKKKGCILKLQNKHALQIKLRTDSLFILTLISGRELEMYGILLHIFFFPIFFFLGGGVKKIGPICSTCKDSITMYIDCDMEPLSDEICQIPLKSIWGQMNKKKFPIDNKKEI